MYYNLTPNSSETTGSSVLTYYYGHLKLDHSGPPRDPLLFHNKFTSINESELPKFKLDEGSILTDCLSGPNLFKSRGLYVNEKMKSILDTFLLPPHQYFKIDVYDFDEQEKFDGYYFLQLVIDNSLVLYEKSIFQKEHLDEEIGDIKFISEEMHVKACMDLIKSSINIKPKIVFLNDVYKEKKYDLFFLYYTSPVILCSSKLMQKLESEEITGISFEHNEIIQD